MFIGELEKVPFRIRRYFTVCKKPMYLIRWIINICQTVFTTVQSQSAFFASDETVPQKGSFDSD